VTKPQDILFSSAEAVRLGKQNLAERRNNSNIAVPIGLPVLDSFVNPLLPGELMTLVARPGSGKTGFMLRWARKRAEWLQEQELNKAVVFASCEQSIEELVTLGFAAHAKINLSTMARGKISDREWIEIEKATIELGSRSTMWWIGPSKKNRKKRPRLTPELIIEAILEMEESAKIKADIVFVDYLQLLKSSRPYEPKQVMVTNNLEECVNGAFDTDAPWVVACQARREVDTQALPIPGLDSGQWTSAVEQYSDKSASLVRPIKYRKEGEWFGDRQVKGPNLMLFSLLKQKLGKDNIAKWVDFDPAYNRLHELEDQYSVSDLPTYANGNTRRHPQEELVF